MSISVQDFPFLSPTQAVPGMVQGGTATNVYADGSVTATVTFPTTYVNIPAVWVSVVWPSATQSGQVITAQAFNVTTTGFSIYCVGGSTGETCSVSWGADG